MDKNDSIDSPGHENDVLEPLAAKEDKWKCSGGLVGEVIKIQCWIVGPMVTVGLIQYSSWMISFMLDIINKKGENKDATKIS